LKQDGHFLMSPTTLERYQSAYFSGIFPHIALEKWEEDGRPRVDRLLRERTRELLAEAEAPDDHDAIVAAGEEFIRGLSR
jgi:trimethylamine:corrinoid methyltransferase-like protein